MVRGNQELKGFVIEVETQQKNNLINPFSLKLATNHWSEFLQVLVDFR